MSETVSSFTPATISEIKTILFNSFITEHTSKERITPVILGPPGIGKTAGVEQFKDFLNEQQELLEQLGLPKKWRLISYRLSQCDPTDLKGVPVYRKIQDKEGNTVELCSYAPPGLFPLTEVPESGEGQDVGTILFFDELKQATPVMMHLAANIMDGVVGDYTIDKRRTFCIAAANRKEDLAAVFEIPRSLGNRILTLEAKPSFAVWEKWATQNEVEAAVIGFLSQRTFAFYEGPKETSHTFCTPRSWYKVSCILKSMGEKFYSDQNIAILMLQGLVGPGFAVDFFAWAKQLRDNYSIEKIFSGEELPVPPRDTLYSIIIEGAYRLNTMIREIIDTPEFKGLPSTGRSDYLVDKLGKDRITKLENLYKWLQNPSIDPSFRLLINVYQEPKSKAALHEAILLHPQMKEVRQHHLQLQKELKEACDVHLPKN